MSPGPSTLKARSVAIDAFREDVVLLARNCTALRPERLSGTRKVEVRANGRTILATILIADDQSLVGMSSSSTTSSQRAELWLPPLAG